MKINYSGLSNSLDLGGTMRDQLLDNIERTLVKDILPETVVYIMVEIRKLIERDPDIQILRDKLTFWCDWVVHTQMDRRFAKETLEQMEQHILENPGEKFHWSYFNSQFISIEDLRQELFNFLEFNNLGTEITNLPRWDKFSKVLVDVLRDCPLKKDTGMLRGFTFIQKDHIPQAQEYSIDYEITFDSTRPKLEGSVLRYRED